MKSHKVIGGGGVELNVVETGNPAGRPILFIHGFTQSLFAWSRQLHSDLADDFRLVAMDIRGHGASGRPADQAAYTDSQLWADDVNAVIQTLNLDRPILVGWSYGPLIILDYIRHYGEDNLRGLQFVGGITKLGTEEATAFLTPDILSLVPGFFSTNAEESVKSLELLVRLFFVNEPAPEDVYLMLGYETLVPPFVRQALFSRVLDNDDLLSQTKLPILITHASEDKIVFTSAAEQIRSVAGHAEMHTRANVGHAVFWEDAAGFNSRLREFASGIERGEKGQPAARPA
jgi:non-heme chloroperoxidase